eukprot:GHVU01186711.1.p1 GENE.GHVU01186711.1~~GHVU01186711.1.p1  ORF type:complete len:281 (+),score=19.79 GHVU01186711.1:51-845(+)
MAESTAAERGKKKRKREAEPQGPRKSGLTLDTVLEQSLDNLPAFLDVNDNQLCLAALGGLERNVLTDMADYFIQSNGIEANESSGFAKPKFVYTRSDELDNFTYYSGQGCPNCGASYELDKAYQFPQSPPALVCLKCGHRAAPLHFYGENDSLVDRLKGEHLQQGGRNCVFLRGTRRYHRFASTGKGWWQNQYRTDAWRNDEVTRRMRSLLSMSSVKAPTVAEDCELCGHNSAFYHAYQARSADEGLTIMYECVSCHNRKVVNS